MASNGWAIGADRSADGGGLLLANPHFPWEGERRFWEAHLTVPGELDIYGAQLSGLPGIGIGFTEEFGWTHTVSAGNRFTAYRLRLVPGSPTTYMYGDEQRPMTATDVTVDVLQPDGTVAPVTRTMYSSHYGPMLDFPGVGWTGRDRDHLPRRQHRQRRVRRAVLRHGERRRPRRVHRRAQEVPGRPAVQHHRGVEGRARLVRRHVGHAQLVRRGDCGLRGVAQDRRRRGAGGQLGGGGPRRVRPDVRVGQGEGRPRPRTGAVPRHAQDRARRLRVQRQRLVLGAAREEVARRRLLAAARPPGDRPLTAHAGKRRRARRHVRHRAVGQRRQVHAQRARRCRPPEPGLHVAGAARRRGRTLPGGHDHRRARAPRRRAVGEHG